MPGSPRCPRRSPALVPSLAPQSASCAAQLDAGPCGQGGHRSRRRATGLSPRGDFTWQEQFASHSVTLGRTEVGEGSWIARSRYVGLFGDGMTVAPGFFAPTGRGLRMTIPLTSLYAPEGIAPSCCIKRYWSKSSHSSAIFPSAKRVIIIAVILTDLPVGAIPIRSPL